MTQDLEAQRKAKLELIRQSIANVEKEDRELATKGAEWVEVRANESMSTGQDWYGQDYVPTDLASQILLLQRDKKSLFSMLPSAYTMPTSNWTIPVESTDNTWYATSENSWVAYDGSLDVTKSKFATDDLVLNAKKYSTSVYLSWELDEDSIIAIRPLLVEKFGKSYTKLLDQAILLGDTVTASTGNINSDDATPTAWTYYLHQDWVIKKARTNSMTKDLWTLDLTDVRDMRALMGFKWLEPSDLILVVEPKTYFKLLSLAQVETVEKFGINATVVNGTLAFIDWIQVLPLSYFGLTDADGKYTTTSPSSNDTKGRMVLIHKPSFVHGFKRQLQIFTEYLPVTDQYRLTAHLRYALNVVGTDSVAYGYNITV